MGVHEIIIKAPALVGKSVCGNSFDGSGPESSSELLIGEWCGAGGERTATSGAGRRFPGAAGPGGCPREKAEPGVRNDHTPHTPLWPGMRWLDSTLAAHSRHLA